VLLLDRVARHADLATTVFRWQHVTADAPEPIAAGAPPRAARARFTLICAGWRQDDEMRAVVDLRHPHGGPDVLRVVLRAGQTLVVPPRWVYACAGALPLSAWRLYDTPHLLLR